MRRRIWISSVAAAALIGAGFAVPQLAAQADPQPEVATDLMQGCFEEGDYEACFADPTGGEDTVIPDRLSELVNAAGDGDSIRIAMYSWGDGYHEQLAQDVVDAAERGADVEVVLDNLDGRHDGRNSLAILDAAVPVTLCVNSCLAEDHAQHNKLFLFDFDGDTTVGLGSANLHANDLSRHNDLLLIDDDAELFDFFTGYFHRLESGSWTHDGETWDTDADRTRQGELPVTAEVYPREADNLVQLLGDVEACEDDSKIWIAVWRLRHHREEIRDELVRLHDEGCDVRVLVPEVEDDDPDWPEMRQWLRDGGLDDDKVGHHDAMHTKLLVIDAVYDGEAQGLVFTGSQNFNLQSLNRNDESTVLVQDSDLTQLYVDFHESMFAGADF